MTIATRLKMVSLIIVAVASGPTVNAKADGYGNPNGPRSSPDDHGWRNPLAISPEGVQPAKRGPVHNPPDAPSNHSATRAP
jgi:hypothetical protein